MHNIFHLHLNKHLIILVWRVYQLQLLILFVDLRAYQSSNMSLGKWANECISPNVKLLRAAAIHPLRPLSPMRCKYMYVALCIFSPYVIYLILSDRHPPANQWNQRVCSAPDGVLAPTSAPNVWPVHPPGGALTHSLFHLSSDSQIPHCTWCCEITLNK